MRVSPPCFLIWVVLSARAPSRAIMLTQTVPRETALQSQLSIGHPRAVRIMKQLEEFKVVGPHEGTKPRRILISLGELETIAPRLGRDGGQQDLFATGS